VTPPAPSGSEQSIPPEVYDRDYFLSSICEGYDEFAAGQISFNKSKHVEMLGPRAGLRVLDAGCGRGEVLLACARAGAEVAGIDYSQSAVELTRATLTGYPGADIRSGSVATLPWPDDSFDRIEYSDVIEHLDPPQTVPAFCEFHRVLRPGGFLLTHTTPNRLFHKFGWPLTRPLVKLAGYRDVAAKVDHWFDLCDIYHRNEQSLGQMRWAIKRAGFKRYRVWLDPDILRSGQFHLLEGFDGPAVRLGRRVTALRPVRTLMGNDLYGLAYKD
jgi:ubiquinone/menaquinone biosynthesis C-methylase UbiE